MTLNDKINQELLSKILSEDDDNRNDYDYASFKISMAGLSIYELELFLDVQRKLMANRLSEFFKKKYLYNATPTYEIDFESEFKDEFLCRAIYGIVGPTSKAKIVRDVRSGKITLKKAGELLDYLNETSIVK